MIVMCFSVVLWIIVFKTLGKGFFSGARSSESHTTYEIYTILPNISMVEIKVYAHKF